MQKAGEFSFKRIVTFNMDCRSAEEHPEKVLPALFHTVFASITLIIQQKTSTLLSSGAPDLIKRRVPYQYEEKGVLGRIHLFMGRVG